MEKKHPESGKTTETVLEYMKHTIKLDEYVQDLDIPNAIEIASAISHMGISKGPMEKNMDMTPKGTLITLANDKEYKKIYKLLSNKNTTLFLPAMPNSLGDGDVASNFRFKHDMNINNDVVKNWMDVLTINAKHKNPIVITTVSRDRRYLTLNMLENGSIKIINNLTKEEIPELTDRFTYFLEALNIDSEKMKIIRMASEGAKFNSYLADMIGFINMVNWTVNPSMFNEKNLEAHVEKGGALYHHEGKEELIIKPVSQNGREWRAKEGYDYMYFRECTNKMDPTLQKFYMINDSEITKVYSQLFNAISLNENDTKKMIRQFMINHNYYRLSDYWVNDVDDGFTLMMILNCFDEDEVELTDSELKIKEYLELIYDNIIN